MESQILELIEEEVTRRVNLRLNGALEVVAKTYDIPLERLMKDAANVEVAFCKGVLKSKKRCLKTPCANGYCKFHEKQMPVLQHPSIERVKAPWE
jgi:hypothetical protein